MCPYNSCITPEYAAGINAFAHDALETTYQALLGEFNEDPTVAAAVLDAAISCVPVVGEVADVRDIIAITIRWRRDPQKMTEVMEWISMSCCCLGLIPVAGGALKGMGRLVVHHPDVALEQAQQLVKLCNHTGSGNAESFLKTFKFKNYESQLLQVVDKFFDAIIDVLDSPIMPSSTKSWIEFLTKLKKDAREMIPKALDELDKLFSKAQGHIDEAGENTSKQIEHVKSPTGADMPPQRSGEGGLSNKEPQKGGKAQSGKAAIKETDAITWVTNNSGELAAKGLTNVKADNLLNFSADIVPYIASLKNQPIWRVHGPSVPNKKLEAMAPGTKAPDTGIGGNWWGTGPMPKNAQEWRETSAVLDEWNADGKITSITIREGRDIHAVNGGVAEQRLGQFLPGGGGQVLLNKEQLDDVFKVLENISEKSNLLSGKMPSLPHGATGEITSIGKRGEIEGKIRMPDGTEVDFKHIDMRDKNKFPEWADVNEKYGWDNYAAHDLSVSWYELAPGAILPKGQEPDSTQQQ